MEIPTESMAQLSPETLAALMEFYQDQKKQRKKRKMALIKLKKTGNFLNFGITKKQQIT